MEKEAERVVFHDVILESSLLEYNAAFLLRSFQFPSLEAHFIYKFILEITFVHLGFIR